MIPDLSCVFPTKPKQSDIFIQEFPSNQLSDIVFLADTHSEYIVDKYLRTYRQAKKIVIPPGECYKTQQTKQQIEEQLFKNKCGQSATLIGVGGGVVCDLAGYVAATYLRGIDLILIPTTLLAMVDAAFGGKNGVNTSFGKNLLGSFHPARQIWIDLQSSTTWTLAHLQEGMAEIIKKSLIGDEDFFYFLTKNTELFLSKDVDFLKTLIKKSLAIKAYFVQHDLTDQGVRRALNFGHTIAHALESSSQFAISHGHAVSIGLCVETWISSQFFPEVSDLLPQLMALLKKLQFPFSLPKNVSPKSLLEACSYDKKNTKTQKRFVLLKQLGIVAPFDQDFCSFVPDRVLVESIEWMFETFKEGSCVY